MGNFYVNVTLRGPGQSQVAGACEALGLKAFISPTIGGLTVVCDQDSNRQLDDWAVAARKLSVNLSCPALAVLNHDDDVLVYELFLSGRVVDEYNCRPDYFDEEGRGEHAAAPAGGNATALCHAFGMPGNVREVQRVLMAHGLVNDEFLFAIHRHSALLKALGCPEIPYEYGFATAEKQEPAEWYSVA